MTFGSLFAGIGGFDLGFERAGMKCVWQVEIDPYCRKVLQKHWPDVPKWDDVKTFTGEGFEKPDVICGGFPCQDISQAGKRQGIEGERSGLWSEYAKIIRVFRPRIVVVENVSALLIRGIGTVLSDLAESGFDAEWFCLPAAAFGAHHNRNRVFVIAYRPDNGSVRPQGEWTASKGPWTREQFEGLVQAETRLSVPAGRSGGISRRVPNRKHRLHALGNCVVPQVAEWIGRRLMESELANRTNTETGA